MTCSIILAPNKANERLWINIDHIDNEVNYNIVNW